MHVDVGSIFWSITKTQVINTAEMNKNGKQKKGKQQFIKLYQFENKAPLQTKSF